MAEWLNEQSLHILQSKYFQEGEDYNKALDRIGKAIEKLSGKKQLTNDVLDAIDKGWLGLASPIWANFGTDRGLPISCFGSYVDDSMDDIADKAKEVMIQTKMGGGTSGYFGALRARGAKIKGNGTTNGPVSFMQIFDSIIEVTSQGNVRRGSFAAYLDAEHPDILEFLNIRQIGNPIQNLLTGVCCSDKFMQSIIDWDKHNRKVWAKILESRINTGTPYIFFTDNVNKAKPKIYEDRRIHHSNLCVHGDTEIYTDEGRKPIKELAGQLVRVWNGETFSTVDVEKTGENQEMVKVITNKGHELICTKYHKFYIKSDIPQPTPEEQKKLGKETPQQVSYIEYRAHQLTEGLELIDYELPVINKEENIKWLEVVINKQGKVVDNRNILLYSDKKEVLLRWVKRIGELGCFATISKIRNGNEYKDVVIIPNTSTRYLAHLGVRQLRDVNASSVKPVSGGVKILKVEPYAGYHDSYCFTEPKKGMGVFNGIVTGQCSEILLPNRKDESFVCCLSSLNIEKYDDWANSNLVSTAIEFLDVVMEEFIRKSVTINGMETAHRFAKNHRALGLGVLGFHSYLQMKNIAFDSEAARKINKHIFKDISEKAKETTERLAKELGQCPLAEEKNLMIRNATTLAIAPTTNNSAILGQTSPGIEPFKSNYYIAGLNDKSHVRKNKWLEKFLESQNLNSDLVWDSIRSAGGSVKNLHWLSPEQKKVFATFAEINPEAIIDMAIDRQEYIDQGQSLNLIIHYNTPVKEINRLYIDAWKKGLKTLYYQRGVNIAKEQSECRSCHS